jgi:hypothetical protein
MGIPSNQIGYINEKANDDAFITNFNNLKDYYFNHQTKLTAVTAGSIYNLCKMGVEYGAFRRPDSTEKWEKVMHDIDSLIEVAKTEADRNYFQRARDLLMKMKQK